MPVGLTVEPVPIPSGEVAPIVGVGVAIPVTCAVTLLMRSAGRTATINESLIGHLRSETAQPRLEPLAINSAAALPGTRLSDIGNPRFAEREVLENVSSGRCPISC